MLTFRHLLQQEGSSQQGGPRAGLPPPTRSLGSMTSDGLPALPLRRAPRSVSLPLDTAAGLTAFGRAHHGRGGGDRRLATPSPERLRSLSEGGERHAEIMADVQAAVARAQAEALATSAAAAAASSPSPLPSHLGASSATGIADTFSRAPPRFVGKATRRDAGSAAAGAVAALPSEIQPAALPPAEAATDAAADIAVSPTGAVAGSPAEAGGLRRSLANRFRRVHTGSQQPDVDAAAQRRTVRSASFLLRCCPNTSNRLAGVSAMPHDLPRLFPRLNGLHGADLN